ncbi:hypothetical protein HYPSUDRAFT_49450 [Hypholoma sublateritium FD-334 SS-4]|uniref:Uncharacterized protein n=1 Tax=Hypholoma sublateritium (strain FD-334 SS-4) TaxID=945553 RepID=A0A0D2N4C4_HYPSF|nr:hypothetical protein HYPSUDRAFT_49450 [Hypholoma sublateritium FD-334 SS-4]
MLPHNAFFASTIPVSQNAVKNIVFRVSAIVLNFVVLRFLAFVAFRRQDYTAFLMFAEDIIQKALFVVDRFNKQAVLVLLFAALTFGAGFYDSLIWAFDAPGYVLRTRRISADALSSQMLPNPAYVTFIPNNISDVDIKTTLGTNLYASGLNFSLPGIYQLQLAEVVPEQVPLTDPDSAPRIWLDTDGFAVGLDQSIMVWAGCAIGNAPSGLPGVQVQGWACATNNSNALNIFEQAMGLPQIWWDLDHAEYLLPNRKDNPWYNLEREGETAIMKQVFTVTKGTRRHTFVQTMLKATMLGIPTLDDAQIADLIRRVWSASAGDANANATVSTAVQVLVDHVLSAKTNGTSYVFGSFIQQNDTVYALSAEFLNIPSSTGEILYSVLRTVVTDTVLVNSETLAVAPTPAGPCALVYRNVAYGGVVGQTNCNTAAVKENQTVPATGPFLGQVDISAVAIMTDILGDGTMNTSAGALDQAGVDWYTANYKQLDQLLISRAMIVGGARGAVLVDTTYAVAAVSYMQLLLVALPFALAIVVGALTLGKPMSYYGSSFLSAVLATTHVTTEACLNIGYMRRTPEIVLRRSGDHFVLKTPFGGTLLNVAGENRGAMVCEPLLFEEKGESTLSEV